MGIPDNSIQDLILKVRSWVSGGGSDLTCLPDRQFKMAIASEKMCSQCDLTFNQFCIRYHCQSCGLVLCEECIRGFEYIVVAQRSYPESGDTIESCNFCPELGRMPERGRTYIEKVYPSTSSPNSPESPSSHHSSEKLSFSVSGESDQFYRLAQYHEPEGNGNSLYAVTTSSMTSFGTHTSPVSVCHSPSRSDEEDAEDSRKHFFSQPSEYYIPDIDLLSVRVRDEFYSFMSPGVTPSVCLSRISFNSDGDGHFVSQREEGIPNSRNSLPFYQKTSTVLRSDTGTEDPQNNDDCADDLSIFHDQYENSQEPLDFENNDLIWYPPPPDDENYDVESNFFEYDDEDDNIGDSGALFSSTSSLSSIFPAKERQNEGNKELLQSVIKGHFRALVSQLLQGEGIRESKENNIEGWLDIVTVIAWQAASFVKPDTSRGGSMDPVDYVKVKCVASGSPSDSTLIKGVVCTKNIKHKRMTSYHKNPRLLILAGALEYQKVPNQLASIDTLLHQENDHFKMVISKIEAFRPNVLLVEKTVSSCAQDYLLEKEISLVLNVKRPLLERIARCTGAQITPSIDNISTTRLGHCELFRLERVTEEHEAVNQLNKKPSKTLMFFEGCPRRLGCTVLLRGGSRDELQKVKHVIQYAVFAAHHLSLETSFLADEGASLPSTLLKTSLTVSDSLTADKAISFFQSSENSGIVFDASIQDEGYDCLNPDPRGLESSFEHHEPVHFSQSPGAYNADLTSNLSLESCFNQCDDLKGHRLLPSSKSKLPQSELCEQGEVHELPKAERIDEITDPHQSILVSFSSRCVLKGTVCERSRLLRIKFYGCFDKPLGKYLREDLFDQTSRCQYCKEPAEAHVQCYTLQHANLTISVKSLSSLKLPGERDGKVWMWHRCLRCAPVDGVPPATPRVVMSDAAWGLSFGKFLELSFSNHATANRVATCGHSLQRDCLRYYGFGSMVAFFRYSHIDILSVQLPSSVLEFNGLQQEWIRKEAVELMTKMETLYVEISDVLNMIEQKGKSFEHGVLDNNELRNHIVELKHLLVKERNDYHVLLLPVNVETSESCQVAVDILELNRLRRSLQIGAHVWDRRLYSLDSLLRTDSISKATHAETSYALLNELRSDTFSMDAHIQCGHGRIVSTPPSLLESPDSESHSEQEPEPNVDSFEVYVPKGFSATSSQQGIEEIHSDMEITVDNPESIASLTSNLYEKIDSAWIGTDQPLVKTLPPHTSEGDGLKSGIIKHNQGNNPPFRRLRSPVRVNSFDSATRYQRRTSKGLHSSPLHLSTLRSFHVSGDYWSTVRNPVSSVTRTYSQILPLEAQKMNLVLGSAPFISTLSHVADGARLLLPQAGHSNLVIAVYDDEPTSIISYALSSKEYKDSVGDKSNDQVGWSVSGCRKEDSAVPMLSAAWQSFGSLDLDYIHYGGYAAEDASSSMGGLLKDSKKSPHFRVAFEDESSFPGDKAKFSVTCYFAKEFDSLREKCCPSEVDFVRSLSRCQRWSAQGGKSNVYFAKSLDERFIIKQVTKTELESFEDFAPEYFKYLAESLNSKSPTCLAKVLGIYQVTVKNLNGGREMKMDLMVMENLFFNRNISRVYDLKGSTRSRYNSDTTGANKVLLDMNLLESLRTNPIFLGSNAKRNLERAVWNDTSFLTSVDVMDYSLLVGVDEERNELVVGIIDFMRQYTWDKHLETWVKASGILGGPKNTSPTIISPKQYKKRFRKAMTSYFLTVPDQWPL